jgi:tetratricopeptide (TPR) repeat protein
MTPLFLHTGGYDVGVLNWSKCFCGACLLILIPALMRDNLATERHGISVAQQDDAARKAHGDESFPGMGALHHPIHTTNEKTQEFFDRGLTFFYAFNFDEAVRSFENAARLDPQAAMPYWGIALANSPNYNSGIYNSPARDNAAREAIQKAQQLSQTSPPSERSYIDALARRFADSPNSDPERRARDYSSAMRDMSHRYQDDTDAATLYAESLMDLHPYHLWTYDGQPGENTMEIVSVLEGVLRRWPDHIGANHFYIHAMEASPFPERASPSADRLETLAPALGHLVHMPAHIYFRTGDYAAAEKSALAAAEADRTYLREKTIPNEAYKIAYVEHNLYFLIASAKMDGDFPVAFQTATELQSIIRAELSDRPDAEPYLATQLFVLLRSARWNDILTLPPPEENLHGLSFIWHYARACSFASKKRVQEAESERDAMEKLYRQIPANQRFGMLGSWTTINELAIQTLDARIAAAQGDMDSAITHWRTAVAEQDRSERADFYRELAAWYCPVRESLAAALLRSKQFSEAEQVFREDLRHNPKNPRSLFGLWKSLEAQKKTAEAEQTQNLFEVSWKGPADQLRIEDF